MPHAAEHPVPEGVSKPGYLTDRQWAGLTLAILSGAVEGCERAGIRGEWASDVGVAAVKGMKERLDVLMGEAADG